MESVNKVIREHIIAIVMALEVVLGALVLKFVPCKRKLVKHWLLDTEIDWVAYMQIVEPYIKGDKNYLNFNVSIFCDHMKYR